MDGRAIFRFLYPVLCGGVVIGLVTEVHDRVAVNAGQPLNRTD
jgi:hypothetical protein